MKINAWNTLEQQAQIQLFFFNNVQMERFAITTTLRFDISSNNFPMLLPCLRLIKSQLGALNERDHETIYYQVQDVNLMVNVDLKDVLMKLLVESVLQLKIMNNVGIMKNVKMDSFVIQILMNVKEIEVKECFALREWNIVKMDMYVEL